MLYRDNYFNLTTGFGLYSIEADRYQNGKSTASFTRNQQSLYSYVDVKMINNLLLTFGLGYDLYEQQAYDIDKLNPKFGLQWNITENLRMRAAAFKTTKRAIVVNQTIEPTQLAGFNQFFDDINGTESKRYGIGLDARLSQDLFVGIEVSKRDQRVPLVITKNSFKIEEDQESLGRAYLYWFPDPNWAVTAEYQYEEFQLKQGDTRAEIIPNEMTTVIIPLSLKYFSPSDFFAEIGATYVHQNVDFHETVKSDTDTENFTVIDMGVGYRLPKRLGIISLNVNNVFSENFRFQDNSFMSSTTVSNPRFIPERTIFAVLNIGL